jgi:Activator of Hsp90 ATPase homolog 1-like protein
MSHAMADSGIFVESRQGASAAMPFDVLASVQIETEIARDLYALTVPEYLEAWLQFPEVDRIECHAERRSYHRFRIDLFSSGTLSGRISASCFISKPNKIRYVFERRQPGRRSESIAEMRLYSRQGICSLDLRHTGLCAHKESTWYSTAWHYSLNRLSKLVEVRRVASPALIE